MTRRARAELPKIDAVFFSKVFEVKLKEWKKKTNKTNEDFAHEVGLQNRISIQKYISKGNKTKAQIPDIITFKKICEVLECDESDFLLSDRSKQYDSLSFQKALSKSQKAFCDDIGLSIDFMDCLKDYFNNFINQYEPCTYPRIDIMNDTISWCDLASSDAFINMKFDSFVLELSSGKAIRLSNEDLFFFKDMQDNVMKIIDEMIKNRAKEKKRQMSEYKKKIFVKTNNGGTITKAITKNMILSTDPYAKRLDTYLHKKTQPTE